MRGLLAGLLVLVGLAAAVYLQTMAYVGGNVLDSARFADTTLTVLAGDDGSAAAARVMTGVVDRNATSRGLVVPPQTRAQVEAGLTRAMRAPGTVEVLRPVVRAAHWALLDGRDARFSLAPLPPQVVRAVEAREPAAAALVPPESEFPVVRVPVAWRDAGPVELGELTAWLDRAGMAKQFWPERLELVDAMPKTPSGKIQKFALRERFS